MPLIHRHELSDSTIRGEDHGASISRSSTKANPARVPGYTATPTTRPGWFRKATSAFKSGMRLKAGPGDVAIIPPGVPHTFVNDGPGRSRIVCIHASPTIVGEWLE
jgi:Cupin domain